MSSYQNTSGPSAKRRRIDVDVFDVGTLVWARLPDAVWWPAIIEKTSSSSYRVLYFDEGCSLRGWVNTKDLLLFSGLEDNIDDEGSNPGPSDRITSFPLRTRLHAALSVARHSLTRSREERAQSLLELGCRFEEGVDVVDAHSLADTPSEGNVPVSVGLGQDEQSIDNLRGGDHEETMSETDTEPAYDTSSTSDSALGADSSDSFNGNGWPLVPRVAPCSEEAVVPGSQEAVCPEGGDIRYDAVVPWMPDADQGGPSSEARVPSDIDDDDEDEDNEE